MEGIEVIVVGAGLAGLACATWLERAGVEVVVLEASDGVGGRLRTDTVDGILLDRGFAVHNPAYPEAARILDQDELHLAPFVAGMVVALGSRRIRLADPRRQPSWALDAARAPIGGLTAKARLLGYVARTTRRTDGRPDVSAARAFADAGLAGAPLERVLRPFLTGVLFDDGLTASRRFVDLVLRSFILGTPGVPRDGMGAIAAQLATSLRDVRLHHDVIRVGGGRVHTADATFAADRIVVATDPHSARQLLPGLDIPPMRSGTTWYHIAPDRPDIPRGGALLVDAERRGPVVSTVVLTDAAPSYAPGRVLVSTTALGVRQSATEETAVRAHLAQLYATDVSRWDLIATYPLSATVPAMLPPYLPRLPVSLGDGRYVCGDHRDTASIQGALVSGRRAAQAILRGD